MEDSNGAYGDIIAEHKPTRNQWVLPAQGGGRKGQNLFFSYLVELPCSSLPTSSMTHVPGVQDAPGAGQPQLHVLPQDSLRPRKTAYKQITWKKHKTE